VSNFETWKGDLPNFSIDLGGNTVTAGVDAQSGNYGVTYAPTGSSVSAPGAAPTKTVIPGWGLVAIIVGIVLLAFGGLARRL
jgi:hypothetical protein